MVSITSYIISYPKISIILIAVLVAFFISLVNYFVLDKEKMRDIKKKQKVLQEEIKQHQKAGNHTKAMELNQEMMSHVMESMKHSFKPMLITIIPIFFIFYFLKAEYALTPIANTWIWYYIVVSIIASIIFRKLFNLP